MNVNDLINKIDTHLLTLRKEGGQLAFPIAIEWDGESQNQNDSNRVLRLSASGKCGRQLAYLTHFPHMKEELSARALNVFIHGDLIHEKERILISQVANLSRIEERVYFDVNDDVMIAGHIDGVLIDGEDEYILDIKSINTRGFKEVQGGETRPDYVAQVQAYMHATGILRAILWFYNKDTSQRHAVVVNYDSREVGDVRSRFSQVLSSTPGNLPDREYKPQAEMSRGKMTGREYLPWQCSYCPFTEMCWSSKGFNLQIDKGKPRWLR